MAIKITPAVWDAVRQAVENHPGLLSEEGSAMNTLPGASGRNLHVALRANLFEIVPRSEIPSGRRGMVRYEAGPTRWRLIPEAQVELDKFLQGGAKVAGSRAALTDTNVSVLERLLLTEVPALGTPEGVSGRWVEAPSVPHVKRLIQFGALEQLASGAVRVTPYGRNLVAERQIFRDYRVIRPGLAPIIRSAKEMNDAKARYHLLLAESAESNRTKGRDAGTALLVIGAVVGGLLLLRPLFRDAFEQHKWNMEHDEAYRRSHQAMEITDAARNIADNLGAAGGRALDRADVVRILADHFRTHPRYKHWSAAARSWFYALSIELVDQGADPASALALTHGLAHNLSALEEFAWNLKTTESIKLEPLRVPPSVVARAILTGKIKISKRPVLSVASERRMRSARSRS